MARRFIVGIGVSSYEDSTLNLAAVPGDVEKVTRWFAEHPTVPHERALPELANSPTTITIQKTLRDWLRERDRADFVVVYLAAHGEIEGNRAYVQGSDSPREGLAGAALDGEILGRIIGQSPPHNVLFIVDACVAGGLGLAIMRSAEDTALSLNTRDPAFKFAEVALCSTFGRDPAYDGLFADAFLKVVSLERWTGTLRPFVDSDLLLEGLTAELDRLKLPQVAEMKSWTVRGGSELIPNPNYGQRQPSALVLDEELAAHFEPSSRGVTRGETGSYFVGRQDELRRLSAWLAAPPESGAPKMMVVTGSPGSGKSALISRAIVLSDRRLRSGVSDLDRMAPGTAPPDQSITAAVWCRNKTLEQLVADVSARFGVNAKTAPALIETIATRTTPLTLAVDALDEAADGQARAIATELLVPLAAVRGVKVVVATRPHPVRVTDGETATTLLDALGVRADDASACIVMDQSPNRQADMRDYVAARLMATGEPWRRTPYSDRPDVARRVATRVAEAAGSSFLVAGVTARALADRPTLVTDAELEHLPNEAGAALASYIDRFPAPQMVRDVLGPLAWAEGAGLPWGRLWAPLATALARAARPDAPTYSDDDVARVLEHAADLIVETSDAGQPVYRLFHTALAEHLHRDVPVAAAHAAFVSVLVPAIEAGTYENAPAYLLAHLPTHLFKAGERGRLGALVTTPDWERAKRARFGENSGFLRDLELAIQAATAAPVDFAALAGACLVFARQIAVAAAPVVSVIAKSGQLERAELMAGNLSFAIERCWAYALLAPTLHAERDIVGASRCLSEAELAIPAINVTHAAMAWAWVAEACVACGLRERARAAARQAASTRNALTPDTAWEESNVYFWAGLAARRAGDDETRLELLTAFRSTVAPLGRNQELQAAAVLGDVDRLRTYWQRWRDDRPVGWIVRDGNLALALADAGLREELTQMLDMIAGTPLQPTAEGDSRGHLAWALAMAGRFDRAFDALATITNREYYLRALGRVVAEARRQNEPAVREKALERVRDLDALLDDRSRAVLVPLLYELGDQDRALMLAEGIIRDAVEPSAMTTVAFPRSADSQSGSMPSPVRRGKTERRHLRTEIASLADHSASNDAIALAREGRLDDARARLQSITMPRYRWLVLREVAQAMSATTEAVDVWYEALFEARRVNEPAARVTAAALALAMMRARGREEEGLRVATTVRDVTKAWTEAETAAEYELLRGLFRSSHGRTFRLEELMAASIRQLSSGGAIQPLSTSLSLTLGVSTGVLEQVLGRTTSARDDPQPWDSRFPLVNLWTPDDVDALIASGQAGRRIFAIVLMRSKPALASLSRVVALLTTSLSAFEQYHVLLVAHELASTLGPDERGGLRRAIEHERSRYITPGSDRYQVSEAVLRALNR